MLLAIDAGNTNIVFAVYKGDDKQEQWRVETQKPCRETLASISNNYNISGVVICSVVPEVNDALTKLCDEAFKLNPIFITYENIDIETSLDNPKQLGADRMVGVSAAIAHYQTPVIIVDFGTATTFDVVDDKGMHLGGVIAPGVNLSLLALEQAASQLPDMKIEKPNKAIGTNTLDAMQSGIYYGYIGLIEGTIKRIIEELGTKPFVIATGGLAPLFDQGTDIFDSTDQDLIMRGLVHIHKVIQNNA